MPASETSLRPMPSPPGYACKRCKRSLPRSLNSSVSDAYIYRYSNLLEVGMQAVQRSGRPPLPSNSLPEKVHRFVTSEAILSI